jgi:chromosome segregation ATPase
MPPTALETHWNGRVAKLSTAKTAAGNAFAAARVSLAGAHAGLEAATTALTALTLDLGLRRKALSEPNLTPAELAARVAALRAKLVEFRAQQATVLAAETAVATGERTVAAHQAEVDRLAEAHGAAQAELAAAAARAKRWAAASEALGKKPLSTLKVDATNATKPADPHWSAAKARVEAEIPKELRERAAERWLATFAAEESRDTALAEISGLVATARISETGGTPGAEAALAAAERQLFGYVQRAQGRFETAVAALKAIPKSPALTTAELAALADSTRVTKGKAAVLLEKARDDKASALAAKRAARETAKRTALAADIDVDLTPILATLNGEVATLEGELTTANTALAAVAADLEDWEATVPEPAWANLRAFEDARRVLGELAGITPANLLSAIDTATTALVTAATADDKRARTLVYLHQETAAERARHDVAGELAARVADGALRGE